MRTILRSALLGGLIFLCGGVTGMRAQEKQASPPSAAEQEVIEKLQGLRMPETISYLQTVDPKVFAEALKTPEGVWAMTLASRWSTPRPETSSYRGKIAVHEYVLNLARQFALLPRSVLSPLGFWRMTDAGERYSQLPDEERNQILDSQDALREGFFLSLLTPVQREATYEIEDLTLQQGKENLVFEGKTEEDAEMEASVARMVQEAYALFRRWGPEKFREVLAGRWSAAQFLKMFARLYLYLPLKKGEFFNQWKLSAMPDWYWDELAEFTEGPNAYPAFSLILDRAVFGSDWSLAYDGLRSLAIARRDSRKDSRMFQATDVLSHKLYGPLVGKDSGE